MTARRIVVGRACDRSSDDRDVCARRRRCRAGRRRQAAAAAAVVAGRQAASLSPGNLITGAWGEQALTPDARGWGWMTKSYVSANAQRPLYNQAKEKLFQDKQVTSVTISSFNPDQYCEARKHWDYIWFEMQHSTLSFNEVQR